MMQEENRERFIQALGSALRNYPFTFELKVKKKPKGIHIIWDVTQEQMEDMLKNQINKIDF